MKIQINIPYFLFKWLEPYIKRSRFYRDNTLEREDASEIDDTLERKVKSDKDPTPLEEYLMEYREERLKECQQTNQQILKWKGTLQFLSGMVETEKVSELAGLLSEDYFWCKMTFFMKDFMDGKHNINTYYRNPLFNSLRLAHSCIIEKGLPHFYSKQFEFLPLPYIENDLIYQIEKEIRDAYEI